MKTSCSNEEKLFVFVEGGLSSEERQEIREHLSKCATCCQQVAALVAETPCFPEDGLPDAFWEHYDDKFQAKLEKAREEDEGWLARMMRMWSTPVSVPFPIAATAVLVIALLSYATAVPKSLQFSDSEKHVQIVDQILIEDVDAAVIFPSDYH